MSRETREKPGVEKPEEDLPRDPPGKPFRTPNKTKTHPAPEVGTDGHRWPEQSEPNKK